MNAAREYILKNYGEKYLPEKPRVFKAKSGAQDAHEAIRPTLLEFTPERVKDSLSRDLYRLYKLIWDRFIASQMESALYDTMSVEITCGDYLFKASGSRIAFKGFLVLYEEGKDDDNGEESDETGILLPELTEGEVVKPVEIKPAQHFTQPPPRYTEATLVKTLEEKGIGRPSTYAPIISTIMSRGYVVKEKKYLYPTELGKIVNSLMEEHFKEIVDVNFTAKMETQLDLVEEGKLEWKNLLNEFYSEFSKTLKAAEESINKVELPVEESDEICEKCGRRMVIKTGKYGKFLACPGFPECRNAKPLFDDAGVKCPKCGGKVLIKKTKRGKSYLGCENYPECDFSTWDMLLTKSVQNAETL